MIQGINHISLSVPSLDKALEFYCGLLGFELVDRASWQADSKISRIYSRITQIEGTAAEAAHVRGPNLVLEIFQFNAGGAKPQDPDRPVIDHGIAHFCLAVTELDNEYQRLKAAGMGFMGEPTKVAPGIRAVYGRDPFGNVIELEEAKGRALASMSGLEVIKNKVVTWGLALVFAALFLGFTLWQTPSLWSGPLTPEDIDHYAAELDRHTVLAPAEKAAFIARVREWAATDDGRPVLLVNLMRYRDRLGELPAAIEFEGTPGEANDYYEQLTVPLALKRGEYPLIGGDAQATSLTASDAEDANQWERVVVMRAPSRRAFIEFMADPAYGPTIPYKMAAADVVLIPVDAQIVVPDLRWLVGGLLLIAFLGVGWWRAARSLRRIHLPTRSGETS
ncbi:MAG: VOC family protein [Pseudomonadales bacterium]|nr:VOC family protein [Halioglobus sp.]MCP5123588.1 VOC family protein [Pseudomonadales bacterium]MCP5193575.1 VOC family protein [Pseudomonadales bacterium]